LELENLGRELEEAISTQTFELKDLTAMLAGNVEGQYTVACIPRRYLPPRDWQAQIT
jgi:hypothetical protein